MTRNTYIAITLAALFTLCNLLFAQKEELRQTTTFFPADKAKEVNPDTHLVLTFPGKPTLGNSGQIRIYDAADNRMVDVLDLSIAPGPTVGNKTTAPYIAIPYEYVSGRFTNANTKPGTPSGTALATPDNYQLTIIGGFTDAFHFYPVIIHDNAATIYPHNNLLEYNKKYYVQIDAGVLNTSDGSFSGITGKTGWTFKTKKKPPSGNSKRLIVSGEGSGDFSTVQGAVDFIPDNNPNRVTIFIKNGTYEEIVYFRNKTNITFLGENRDKTIVCYANNEVFNPHPSNISTNEMPGTFPSRRAAFMGDNSKGIHLVNFTVKTTAKGQAEGLLLAGGQNIVSNVNIEGSGDALQVNGPVYLTDCNIVGDGDIILGRGPAFFNHCQLISHGGAFMWIRNTSANHGNVFLNCTFQTEGSRETEIARAPTNKGKDYPYSEAVLLNCSLSGISPAGWGPVGPDTSNIHYWEYNSIDSNGKPIDVSKRHPASRQLTKEKDADIIANYSNPAYVLGGWDAKPLAESPLKSL
jgi:pectin methylesterase-like acyl-CoA thioesterase